MRQRQSNSTKTVTHDLDWLQFAIAALKIGAPSLACLMFPNDRLVSRTTYAILIAGTISLHAKS